MPPALIKGDTIAILSPSRKASKEAVERAMEVIQDYGFTPILAPNVYSDSLGYAGTPEARFTDLKWAFTSPSVKAILASKGGYGAVQLIDSLATLKNIDSKWLIGFSDITVLHSWLSSKGVASIHGPMTSSFTKDRVPIRTLFEILEGDFSPLLFSPNEFNRPGVGEGILKGGNLAVMADLIATPYDMITPGTILFIEDVDEPIYKIERIMWQLKLSGKLEKLAGLIVGQFTSYKPETQYHTMEEMIAEMVKEYNFPVVFGAPIGHVGWNTPIIESMPVKLVVTPGGKGVLTYL